MTTIGILLKNRHVNKEIFRKNSVTLNASPLQSMLLPSNYQISWSFLSVHRRSKTKLQGAQLPVRVHKALSAARQREGQELSCKLQHVTQLSMKACKWMPTARSEPMHMKQLGTVSTQCLAVTLCAAAGHFLHVLHRYDVRAPCQSPALFIYDHRR